MACATHLFQFGPDRGPSPAISPAPFESNVGAALPAPEVVRHHVINNRYLPGAQLQQGPLGVTYEAYDVALDGVVWMEFLRGCPDLPRCPVSWDKGPWDSVRQAIAKLACLGSRHVVEILGRGVLDGSWPFLVTQPPEGRSLRQLIDGGLSGDLSALLRIGRQLAAGLEAAHGAGVWHTALTPEQVAVAGTGTDVHVEIGGLGLAPLVRIWREALLSGAPELGRYASPEQILTGEVDARSDVYSLGAILYELATGAPPFVADDPAQLLWRQVNDPLETLTSRLGSNRLEWRALDQILRRCLAKRREERYPSAAELGRDLARLERAWSKPPAAPSVVARQIYPLPKPRSGPARLPKVMIMDAPR